jgi:outer membrane protein TolC
MKKVILTITLLLLISPLYSRQVTLQSCIDEAVQQSPLIKQKLLYENSSELEVNNLRSVYLPQFSIDGQATYQSDIFSIPISFPGVTFPTVPKAQFQAAININQTIYDGGFSTSSIEKQELDTKASKQSVEVNLFKVKDAVTLIYFSVLLLQDN